MLFRDKKGRRDKKGHAQNGSTSPSHKATEPKDIPALNVLDAQSVRLNLLVFNLAMLALKITSTMLHVNFEEYCCLHMA